MSAARNLPLLLQRLQRPPQPQPSAALQLAELRRQLLLMARRRDAVTLGAVLLLGGCVWLALQRGHPWRGWALLAAGVAKLLYGFRARR